MQMCLAGSENKTFTKKCGLKSFRLQDDTEWYAYGFRMYDPALGRFPSLDPKADAFPHVSPYNYAENSPISNIDLWGLQASLVIYGEMVAASTATGATTSAQAANNSAAHFQSGTTYTMFGRPIRETVNNVKMSLTLTAMKVFSPEFENQQKNDSKAKEQHDRNQAQMEKDIKNDVTGSTPDGSPQPKGGGKTVAKVVAGVGFAAAFVKACDETTGGDNQNSSSENQSSENTVTTISQGSNTSESTSNTTTNSEFTIPVYTTPSDNTRVAIPIIPL